MNIESMDRLQIFNNEQIGYSVAAMTSNGEVWFRGKDVASMLGYVNTKQALIIHVDEDDKKHLVDLMNRDLESIQVGGLENRPLDYNEQNTIFINEAGFYGLILSSKKPEAKLFRKWVVSEVLPSLRATGRYTISEPIRHKKIAYPQFELMNENDLHYKVMDFLRKHFPDAIIIPGLGELQRTSQMRTEAWCKGYQGGQPDILILNRHRHYNGFALELKTPAGTGRTSENQAQFLSTLEETGYLTMVSNDYDQILLAILNYFNDVRFQCEHCRRSFKTKETRAIHLRIIHRR